VDGDAQEVTFVKPRVQAGSYKTQGNSPEQNDLDDQLMDQSIVR